MSNAGITASKCSIEARGTCAPHVFYMSNRVRYHSVDNALASCYCMAVRHMHTTADAATSATSKQSSRMPAFIAVCLPRRHVRFGITFRGLLVQFFATIQPRATTVSTTLSHHSTARW
jgi:hypothetical protein